MKRATLSAVLSVLLAVVLLATSLPLVAFAATSSGAANYDAYRGSSMTADRSTGVMIYDALKDAGYYKKSKANEKLSTDYTAAVGSTTRDFYPDLTADWAIYYDGTIKGTTVIIEQGLSEIDAVQYVDKNGNITKGDAPSVLTASNGGDATNNAGYGVNAEGKNTRYYEEKSIFFYIINHSCSERIGTEDDVSILTDYIKQGYVVVTLDYKGHADAVSPYIEQSLVSARAMFNSPSDTALKDLGVTTSPDYIYFVPEGCRLARDIWFWDSSIWGVNGIMEYYRATIWNKKIGGEAKYDTLGVGDVDTVEEMITAIKQKDGVTPIDYKLSLNIIYPSQPKYEVPVFIHEGTNYIKERNYLGNNSQGAFTGFALNGYACVQYDHPYFPFAYRNAYSYSGIDSSYGTQSYSAAYVARAAMRCARYYADTFGYSSELAGAAGISKGSRGAAVLSVVNNKKVTVSSKVANYAAGCCEGDIFTALPEGTTEVQHETTANRIQAIVQPFMYYDDGTEISSEVNVAYVAAGEGAKGLYGSGTYAKYDHVPTVYSCGTRDQYKCWDYWANIVDHVTNKIDGNSLLIPQLDQGHAYPFGYDEQYGYDRFMALMDFFELYLRPDDKRAPEVLWMTPLDGAADVTANGVWNNGPWTPYKWDADSYYEKQAIQVRFLGPVDPQSVNTGVEVRDAAGKRIAGEWEASLGDTLYTFVTDGLCAGTTYTVTVTNKVVSQNNVPLAEERSVTFTTEGSYALRPVADTYVASNVADSSFDGKDTLIVDGKRVTLLTYPTASIKGASHITLNFESVCTDAVGFAIYALPNYSVKDANVTYNTLTASDAWANKITVGRSYTVETGFVQLDLSSLASATLGDYVTLALVNIQKNPFTMTVVANETDESGRFTLVTTNSKEVTFRDGELEADDEFKASGITSAQVILGADITVQYYATLGKSQAAAKMRFTVGDKVTTVAGVKDGDEYVFSCEGIAPQSMGVNIKAELVLGKEVLDVKDNYSVLTNCKNLLSKTAAELGISTDQYAAMKTLIADLLAYGAASQTYRDYNTNALVNDGITGQTVFETLDSEDYGKNLTASTVDGVGIADIGAVFDNTNTLYFRFTAPDITKDNFLVRIQNAFTGKVYEYTLADFTVVSAADSTYMVTSEAIAPTAFDNRFVVTLVSVNGDVETKIQSLEGYGMNSYICAVQNETDNSGALTDLAKLARAVCNYGLSAEAYANAK